MAMLNLAAAEMDMAVGGFGMGPQVVIPSMPNSATTVNNIRVENSTVGAINTAAVSSIQVSLGQMHAAGMESLEASITNLTEAVANEASLAVSQRNDLLDQIAFVSQQAAAAAHARNPGMIKAALAGIGSVASTVSGVATAWTVCAPLLKGIFGLQ